MHNLEHGYTIVWYDATTPKAEQDELKKLAPLARDEKYAGPKFIVSAWDQSHGAFPAGKHIAHLALGRQGRAPPAVRPGLRRSDCKFVQTYPSTDSPEPTAA